jgi:hypothetical protein
MIQEMLLFFFFFFFHEMLTGTYDNFIAFLYSQQRLMSCSINTEHENLKRFMAWFHMKNVLIELLHCAEHNNYLGKSKLKKIYICLEGALLQFR